MQWARAGRCAVAILLLACSLRAYAQMPEAAALVLEVAGGTTPAITAFSELRAGSKVTLAADATLRFVHYQSCRMTRVRGGELTVLPSGHLLRGGSTESDELRACPKRLRAGVQSGVAGGLVMRGAGSTAIQLAPQPALMIAGTRAEQFAKVLIEGADAQFALQRTPAAPVWRFDGAMLAPGAYRLVALAADGRKLIDEAVSVAPAGPEMTILRAD